MTSCENIKREILDLIEEYETIIISRHIRPDGDAAGSTLGLAGIIRNTYPEKRVFLDNEDYSEYAAFLGDEGEKPTDADYENALVIVVDTGTLDRISNSRVLKGKKLIKIDHHIDDKPYGDVSWVEEERSSACEMIVDLFLFSGKLKMDRYSATCLYTGMITDSGRFRYRGTCAGTLRCAAVLLDYGIDIETIYANLYMDDIDTVRFEAEMKGAINVTENGVAWLRITKETRAAHGLSMETASAIISVMDGIKGSLIWIAFIENDDGTYRVRLRSRFVEVQELASRYHGGGHACASGATVYSEEEAASLLKDADGILRDYKSENKGWI
ncbi:MAG: bifunctional oligoribonuclease/PAP phosphatase NrnA [Clostridia bacterium]|nr:bifunctional oligoribonuclease/PAP phosphatase NrnA [Clostridia bacterium]MBR5768040.1 bifunctional oligoribonuclease/PAP phosphatase NrnA [Clostridia bacterium]